MCMGPPASSETVPPSPSRAGRRMERTLLRNLSLKAVNLGNLWSSGSEVKVEGRFHIGKVG